jgi:hypothetical protein
MDPKEDDAESLAEKLKRLRDRSAAFTPEQILWIRAVLEHLAG